MVWKFCEIWKSYKNKLSEGPNSVRFYLKVWGMACISMRHFQWELTTYTFLRNMKTDSGLGLWECKKLSINNGF